MEQGIQELNSAGLTSRGNARYLLGDFDGAIADYSKAIELDPQNELAYCNRGKARHVRGDLDDAISDYSRAIELDPRDAYALRHRGVVFHTRKDLDRAIEDYSRSIEVDPNDPATFRNRGEVRKSKGDLEGALGDYSRSIELDPNNAATCIHRGIVRHARSDFAGAIADYTLAMELDPGSALVWFNRGLSRKAMGDLQGATSDFTRAVELDPNDADSRTVLASTRRQGGVFCEDCVRGSAATSFPRNVKSLNGIGRMFYGEESHCPTCSSCVRSLWFTFLFLPVVPLGSYRIMYTDFERGVASTTEKFHVRRTELCWKQILLTWLAGLLVVAGSVAGFVYLVSRARS